MNGPTEDVRGNRTFKTSWSYSAFTIRFWNFVFPMELPSFLPVKSTQRKIFKILFQLGRNFETVHFFFIFFLTDMHDLTYSFFYPKIHLGFFFSDFGSIGHPPPPTHTHRHQRVGNTLLAYVLNIGETFFTCRLSLYHTSLSIKHVLLWLVSNTHDMLKMH